MLRRRAFLPLPAGPLVFQVPEAYDDLFNAVRGPGAATAHLQALTVGTKDAPPLNLDTFTFLASSGNHLCIKDKNGVRLLYRHPIPAVFTDTLASSEQLRPSRKFDAHKRGEYTTRIYALWKKYTITCTHNKDYKNDNKNGKAEEWLMSNQPLFKYLSDDLLRHIDIKMHDRFKGPQGTVPEGLNRWLGAWHSVTIGQGMVDGGTPHLDNDVYFGHHAITGWGRYETAQLD